MPDAPTLALSGARRVARHRDLALAAGICGFAAATAVAAQVRIALPFSPVPLTLQTLLVLASGLALGARAGAASQALYVALGAAGVPVFAAFGAGLGGATTGYLLAFPLAAALVGWGARRGSAAALAGGLLAGTMAIYLLGAGWLWLVMGKSLTVAFMAGVVPFVWGDALKLAALWCATGSLRSVSGMMRGKGW